MDLVSTIRKEGSRGGVNFSWDDVSTSQHRENYLGHSLMAPVGRWQKGKDLSWYAKADDAKGVDGETAEEKRVRERKEEIRRIKEAEEDALARALGLPVADRGLTGSNAITVGEVNRVIKEAGVGEHEDNEDMGKGKGFGDFVGKVQTGGTAMDAGETEKGGLMIERGDTDDIDIDHEVEKGVGTDLGVGRDTDIAGGKKAKKNADPEAEAARDHTADIEVEVRTGTEEDRAGTNIEASLIGHAEAGPLIVETERERGEEITNDDDTFVY